MTRISRYARLKRIFSQNNLQKYKWFVLDSNSEPPLYLTSSIPLYYCHMSWIWNFKISIVLKQELSIFVKKNFKVQIHVPKVTYLLSTEQKDCKWWRMKEFMIVLYEWMLKIINVKQSGIMPPILKKLSLPLIYRCSRPVNHWSD